MDRPLLEDFIRLHLYYMIRRATIDDQASITRLLDQLDYPGTQPFIEEKIHALLQHPDQVLLVYESDRKIVGVISVHFIPQLAVRGDFAIISYLSVDASVRSQGIGKQLEEYAVQLAGERGCDRIQLHCSSRREAAHRFYERQGYKESPKYFNKPL